MTDRTALAQLLELDITDTEASLLAGYLRLYRARIGPDQSRPPLSCTCARGPLAELRVRITAIPAGSYERDPGFSVAISRVLSVLAEVEAAHAR